MISLIVLAVSLIAADSFQAVAAQCMFGGEAYGVGESVYPANCTRCTCSGDPPAMRCSLVDNCPGNENDPTIAPPMMNPCDSSPCQNNGTCRYNELDGSFSCICLPTYTGRTCEAEDAEEPTTTPTPGLDVPCERPIITKFSGRVLHEIGSRHPKLRCQASGVPQPTISWAPIRHKRRFIDNSEGMLTIKSPRPEDAGIYTCTASNECGEDSVETELVVAAVNLLLVCPELSSLENGEIEYEGDMSPGTIARFYCKPEHEIFGPESAGCLDNGEWNDTLPECLPFRQCPQPSNPKHGRVISRRYVYQPGDEATFECNKRYTNVGFTYQVCGENLKWSREGPICRKKKGLPRSCGNPGDIENGLKRGTRYTVGSLVYYTCSDGYFISGRSQIECLPNGLWSYPPPTCEITLEDIGVLARNFADATGQCEEESSTAKIAPVNLIFVLDKSGSVSNADFRLSLEFVKETVKKFRKTCFDVNISVVTYSRNAELEFTCPSPVIVTDNNVTDNNVTDNNVTDNNVTDNNVTDHNVKDHLRNIRRRTYGPTATRRGLDVVRDDLIMYNRPCYVCTPPTERPPDKDYYTYPCPICKKECIGLDCEDCGSTLLFLVTDGKSNWAGDPRHAAECLKANGVEIFAVGVTSHINIAELRDIASEPLHSHLYLLKTFEDALKLVSLAQEIS